MRSKNRRQGVGPGPLEDQQGHGGLAVEIAVGAVAERPELDPGDVADPRDAAAIEFCDLSFACTTWAVGQKLAPHDPFRFGAGAIND